MKRGKFVNCRTIWNCSENIWSSLWALFEVGLRSEIWNLWKWVFIIEYDSLVLKMDFISLWRGKKMHLMHLRFNTPALELFRCTVLKAIQVRVDKCHWKRLNQHKKASNSFDGEAGLAVTGLLGGQRHIGWDSMFSTTVLSRPTDLKCITLSSVSINVVSAGGCVRWSGKAWVGRWECFPGGESIRQNQLLEPAC